MSDENKTENHQYQKSPLSDEESVDIMRHYIIEDRRDPYYESNGKIESSDSPAEYPRSSSSDDQDNTSDPTSTPT